MFKVLTLVPTVFYAGKTVLEIIHVIIYLLPSKICAVDGGTGVVLLSGLEK